MAALVLLAVVLWWWTHRRRGRRNKAELEAAKRVDPTDAQALAAVPLEALDELSKQIVVDVDNAVRTSTNELELATEEFGAVRVAPFAKAVKNAKSDAGRKPSTCARPSTTTCPSPRCRSASC